MNTYTSRISFILLATLLLDIHPALAEGLRVQGIVGATKIDDDEIEFKDLEELDEELQDEVDLPTMFTVGAAAQQSLGNTQAATQFGIESGILISFAKEKSNYRSNGNRTVVSIDTSLILGDLFLGVFLSQDFGEVMRIYAAAGPLLMLGRINGEFDDEDPSIRRVQEDENAVGVGGYARAGIEFAIAQGGTFGIGGRAFKADLDFKDTLGKVDFEGIQGFVTYTQGF